MMIVMMWMTFVPDCLLSSGDASIPPSSTVMLLYSGREWVDIEALKAPVQVGVQIVLEQFKQ